jgi:hypothetical protein
MADTEKTPAMLLDELAVLAPIAYDDYYSDHRQGWEVGSGSGIRHPLPPAPPKGTHDTTMRSWGMGHPPSTTIADAALRRILGSET